MNPDEYLPVEGEPNKYRHPVTRHTLICREGQTKEQLIAEMELEATNPPAPLTLDQQDIAAIEANFTQPSVLRAVGQVLFQLTNDVRVLKGQPAITVAQFKTAFKNLIRG